MRSPYRPDFPALANQDIAYLDSAATCQVPSVVIEAINDYLTYGQGNAGRGMHQFSQNADSILTTCRGKVADFINADQDKIIFTKSTTESINIVANGLRSQLCDRDSILVTELEHHSNLLPWQRLCQLTGAKLNILPIDESGNLNCENLDEFLNDNCRLFAISQCSNVLGNYPQIEQLIAKAKFWRVQTLVDGAQAIAHIPIDVKQMGCDYYVFSGHKLYAPSGSGILYANDPMELEPLLLGGGNVLKATLDDYLLTQDATKFEAGTANLVSLVGLSSAIDYLSKIGYSAISQHETKLHQYLTNQIKDKTNFNIISHSTSRSLVSFYSDKIHCHDVASLLAEKNIAIRAGHHCAQPCLNAIGIKHCLRASIGIYNDVQDIDRLIRGLVQIEQLFN